MRWIIGDIHGMLRPLERLLTEIERHDPRAKLIFCGDYVNRGPESRGVVDLLLSLPRAVFCRGNHDDTFDLLLNGKCYISQNQLGGVAATFEHFMKYGLDNTLVSYGIAWPEIHKMNRWPSPEGLKALLEPVPATHRAFFQNLQPVYDGGDFFVAHAKWDVDDFAGVPSFSTQLARSMKLRYDVIWGRYTGEELYQAKPWNIPGFFGHTPVTIYNRQGDILPIVAERTTLLDTAAAIHLDGRLTAWCFEENRYIQAEREGQQIREGR